MSKRNKKIPVTTAIGTTRVVTANDLREANLLMQRHVVNVDGKLLRILQMITSDKKLAERLDKQAAKKYN